MQTLTHRRQSFRRLFPAAQQSAIILSFYHEPEFVHKKGLYLVHQGLSVFHLPPVTAGLSFYPHLLMLRN
jgi:hypothetical protein